MDKADAFAASYSIPVVYARDPSFVGDEFLSYRLVATDRIVRYLSRNRDGVQVFSVYWNDRIMPNVRELKYPGGLNVRSSPSRSPTIRAKAGRISTSGRKRPRSARMAGSLGHSGRLTFSGSRRRLCLLLAVRRA